MSGKVIQIASYHSPIPAHLDKSLLESEGIRAEVQDGQVIPHFSFFDTRGAVRLLINEEDQAMAQQLLLQHPNDDRLSV